MIAVQQKILRKTLSFDLRTAFAVASTVMLWASAFAGIRVGLEGYTPAHVALLRYLTASIALLIYALITRLPLPRRADLPTLALLGFSGITLYNIALNAGEAKVSAGVASLIIASAPAFVALLARSFLKERLTIWAWIGISICFGGVAIIALGESDGWRISASALLVLIAAIAQSCYSVGQKPYLKRYSPLQFVTYAIWAGTFFLLPFLPGLIQEIPHAPTHASAAVIYMGIFPGAIGYISWSYVLSRLPASRAGSFLYLVPATAILIAWVWLGEVPAVISLFGGVLILAGVITVNVHGRK